MKIIFKKPLWFTDIMTLCLVAVTLFAAGGCDKHEKPEGKIEYVKTELGGCNVQQPDLTRGDSEIENDVTVIITISEDSVNVFVGLTFTCKTIPFETQVETIDDVLYMHIIDTCGDDDIGGCYERCYCYYTFDFVFKYEREINQKYKILLYNGFLREFEGYISIISEGIINSNKSTNNQ